MDSAGRLTLDLKQVKSRGDRENILFMSVPQSCGSRVEAVRTEHFSPMEYERMWVV